MKSSLFTFLPILLTVAGCNPSEKEKMLREAESSLLHFTQDKIRSTHDLYKSVERITSAKNASEFQNVKELHRICTRFYAFADSIGYQYGALEGVVDYNDKYPLNKLDSAYQMTLDSMKFNYPQGYTSVNFRRNDYLNSAYREAALLTSKRMQYDIAMNELAVLTFLNSQTATLHQQYPDDGTTPYNVLFPSSGSQYKFSVNSKYLQQFPYRDIQIDSVMKDGKRIAVDPRIDNRDIICVVHLNDLKKGKYVVKVRLWDRSILHRFEIRKINK